MQTAKIMMWALIICRSFPNSLNPYWSNLNDHKIIQMINSSMIHRENPVIQFSCADQRHKKMSCSIISCQKKPRIRANRKYQLGLKKRHRRKVKLSNKALNQLRMWAHLPTIGRKRRWCLSWRRHGWIWSLAGPIWQPRIFCTLRISPRNLRSCKRNRRIILQEWSVHNSQMTLFLPHSSKKSTVQMTKPIQMQRD